MQRAFFPRIASSRWLRQSAAALSLGLLVTVAQAQTFRFALAQHDFELEEREGNDIIDPISRNPILPVIGSTFATLLTSWEDIPPFTNDPSRSMRSDARTDWGVNGVRASVVNVPSDRAIATPGAYGAYPMSIWSDAFRVTTGTSIGVLDFSARLDGTLSGSNTEVVYAVWYSDRPFGPDGLRSWLNSSDSLGVNGELLSPPDASLAFGVYRIDGDASGTYRALVPYAIDETVYVASLLTVSAIGPTSTADFYNSAYFGVSAPAGAELTAASGFTYATSVPEASTLSMAALGLMALGAWRLRRLS